MLKLRVEAAADGLGDIWLPESLDACADWLGEHLTGVEEVHSYSVGPILLGADWAVASVTQAVRDAGRVAITTGARCKENMQHALSVINTDGRLYLFDIGPVEVESLEVVACQH